ncbi:putative membrane protein [Proteiniphilum saccharofermentans]|uniref:Putative membrane protein n=1 Tax=Proteiniphilum saccharofermentans TaxID=1642647 RepID=A0A1R3T9H3_9BACT|nr:DUF5007 domain-containing protein [Proteiniphilum saccharofermentans]SCD21948.1 putative membrane protein [Proteiniphilum saccharofermentans]
MKKQIKFLGALIIMSTLFVVSCFQEPDGIGYLSDDIYLKGADTIYVSIGGKGNTDYAWTDNSSEPLNFAIENIRDASNNRSAQFFEKYIYRTWIKPYDFLTDKTEEQVMAKLEDREVEPVMINPVNGQLLYTEVTSNLSGPGDVYHVDVRVTNSKGSKLYPDYAILKLTSDARAFTVNEVINGISVVRGGANNFVLYDQINTSQPDFITRRNNIYADNGVEFVRIHKVSDEPNIGIRVIFKLLDSKGALFNPAEYATYAAGTYSYIDHSINRQNTSEGMIVEFPTTPWPTNVNFMSYLRGPTATDFHSFDIDKLYEDFLAGKVPSLIAPANWPENNWADASAWFVRIRSIITFYESGTWEVSCQIPYTAIDGNFTY